MKDVYDAVYPIVISTALFGLSSIFTEKHNQNRKYKTYNILKILNVIYITAYTFLLYLAVDDLENNNEFQPNYASGVAKIGIVFQVLAQIVLTYTIYLFNISKSEQILSIINDIGRIDSMFEDLGETLNYRKHFLYEIFIIALGFLVICGRALIAHIYTGTNVVAKENKSHFVFFFPAFVSFLLQNSFVFLVFLLYERFVLINKLLDNLLIEEKANQNLWKMKPLQDHHLKHTVKRIELLMEAHDFLTDVGNKANDTFTIQILCCLTAQFLTEVFTVFYVYYESLILKNKTAAVVWMLWTFCTTLEIFNISITCHLTVKQAGRATGIAIHKVLLNELDAPVKRKLIIFSQQVSQRPLQFSACGLFPIDATLIFTIAGAAATYLLIMLQFQEGVEAQCSNSTF